MFNDFKLDNEVEREEKKKLFGLSKVQIGLIIFIIIALLIILFANTKSKSNDIRVDKNKDYVYTTYKSDTFEQEIPYININSEEMIKTNKDISDWTKEFKDNEYSTIKYEYQMGGGFDNLLSLIITAKYENEDVYRIFYSSYNIDTLKRRQASKSDVLKAYGLTTEDVEKIVEEEFRKFYKDEIDKEFVDKEKCDFKCYMDMRKIEEDNYSYYVDKNGKLILYLSFIEDTDLKEQNYFEDTDHIFILKDKPE